MCLECAFGNLDDSTKFAIRLTFHAIYYAIIFLVPISFLVLLYDTVNFIINKSRILKQKIDTYRMSRQNRIQH